MDSFENRLTGGHPNSLGNTVEVVEAVLADPARLEELFACYGSDDAVVRLRVSSALKRVEIARHDLVVPYIDRLITEVGALDQPSAQWTLALLFEALWKDMSSGQQEAAMAILKRNLQENPDWIVLNNSMQAIFNLSKDDPVLRAWLVPQLERLTGETRKSVVGRATKLLARC